jgi:hypothetical protein
MIDMIDSVEKLELHKKPCREQNLFRPHMMAPIVYFPGWKADGQLSLKQFVVTACMEDSKKSILRKRVFPLLSNDFLSFGVIRTMHCFIAQVTAAVLDLKGLERTGMDFQVLSGPFRSF